MILTSKQRELEEKITCLNHKQQELEQIENLEWLTVDDELPQPGEPDPPAAGRGGPGRPRPRGPLARDGGQRRRDDRHRGEGMLDQCVL